MIEFHDPRAEVGTTLVPYTLGVDVLDSARGEVTIGLVANGFPDSAEFLEQIAAALESLRPGVRLARWNKGNASIPASDEMLAEIESGCDAAIAAYGH